MKPLCQQLHIEFSKVKAAQDESRQALGRYIEQGDLASELEAAITDLNKAKFNYENYCKSAQKLPDGSAIWLPEYLALGNLAELNGIDLSSILERIEEESINPESTRLLKLDLSGLNITTLGNALSPLSNLQTLYLIDCEGLSDLGASLDNLINLQTLSLTGCRGLSDLGISLEKLVNLQTLSLRYCRGLSDLGVSLEKLVNLQTLNLWFCSGLSDLGTSLYNLVNLQTLSLGDCSGLSDLGISLEKLVNLQTLDLWNCSGLTSLGTFVEILSNLTRVDIKRCNNLPESERARLRSIPNCTVEE